MAERISFGDRLFLEGERLVLDNGPTEIPIIESMSGTIEIRANLIVQGNTTTVNTETVVMEDPVITLNHLFEGDPDNPAGNFEYLLTSKDYSANESGNGSPYTANVMLTGLEVERGDLDNVRFLWDESYDRWTTEDQNFFVGGTFTTYDLEVMNNANIGNELRVENDTFMYGDLTLGPDTAGADAGDSTNFYHTGDQVHTGDTTQTGDYNLTGNISHAGNTNQTGNVTQNGDYDLTGRLTHVGETDHTGNTNQTGNYTVTGDVRITGSLFQDGETTSLKSNGGTVIESNTSTTITSPQITADGDMIDLNATTDVTTSAPLVRTNAENIQLSATYSYTLTSDTASLNTRVTTLSSSELIDLNAPTITGASTDMNLSATNNMGVTVGSSYNLQTDTTNMSANNTSMYSAETTSVSSGNVLNLTSTNVANFGSDDVNINGDNTLTLNSPDTDILATTYDLNATAITQQGDTITSNALTYTVNAVDTVMNGNTLDINMGQSINTDTTTLTTNTTTSTHTNSGVYTITTDDYILNANTTDINSADSINMDTNAYVTNSTNSTHTVTSNYSLSANNISQTATNDYSITSDDYTLNTDTTDINSTTSVNLDTNAYVTNTNNTTHTATNDYTVNADDYILNANTTDINSADSINVDTNAYVTNTNNTTHTTTNDYTVNADDYILNANTADINSTDSINVDTNAYVVNTNNSTHTTTNDYTVNADDYILNANTTDINSTTSVNMDTNAYVTNTNNTTHTATNDYTVNADDYILNADTTDINSTTSVNLDTSTYTSNTTTTNENSTTHNINTTNLNITGTVSQTGNVDITGDLGVDGDTVITGNLTVQGTTTTVDSVTVEIADNILLLNSNFEGDPNTTPVDGGIEIERGTGTNVKLYWDESADTWTTDSQDFTTTGTIHTKDLEVSGNAAIGGTTTMSDDLTLTGEFSVTGNTTQSGDVTTTGNYDITGNTTQSGDVTTTGNYTITGNIQLDGELSSSAGLTGNLTGNVFGNADTASKWFTPRTVTFATGDVSGSFTIDGSADVTNVNLQVANDSHTHDGRYWTETENENEISRSVPAGAEGQVPFIAIDGTRTSEQDYTLSFGQFVENDTELTEAQSNIVTFQEVFDTWYRFSHNATATQPASPAELTAWSYDSLNDTIQNTTNSATYIGLVSYSRLANYTHEVRLSSVNSDDDAIGVLIAWYTDPADGREYTLSAMRTPGGNGFTWRIVYNYARSDEWVVADGTASVKWGNGAYGATAAVSGYVTNQTVGGWDDFGTIGTKVRIQRAGDTITAQTTDLGSNTYLGGAAVLNIDLTSDTRLAKFRGPKAYGYTSYSQANSTWDVLELTDPLNSIIDIRDGSVYYYVGGSWVLQGGVDIFDEVGIGRFVYNTNTQKMYYITPDGAVNVGSTADNYSFTLDGDLSGVVNIDSKSNVVLTATVNPNSVALGTDTTGAYVADIVQGSGITLSETASGAENNTVTVNHADTSSQVSVNNSNGTVIQDITLDTFGHITSIGSYNLDNRYYTETEIDNNVVQGSRTVSVNSVSQNSIISNPNPYGTSNTDLFGAHIDSTDGYFVVGAHAEDEAGGTTSGKVYVYSSIDDSLITILDNPNNTSTPAGDSFGYAVGISGEIVVAGAYAEDTGGSNSGVVYVFNGLSGELLYTLSNPNDYDTAAGDSFGRAVDIDGDYIIVGAPYEDSVGSLASNVPGYNSGRVYIFNAKTGALIHSIADPNAHSFEAYDYFGEAVAIYGNYAVVGTRREDPNGSSSGTVYVYNVTTGTLLYRIDNPNLTGTGTDDEFGYSVALDDQYLVISARYEDVGATNSGSIYVYNVTTGGFLWSASNPAGSGGSSDYFGTSVSVSEGRIVVGEPRGDTAGTDSGNIHIYEASTGTLLHTVADPNGYSTGVNDYFGDAVTISGTKVIASAAYEDDASGTDSGKVYTFDLTKAGEVSYTVSNNTNFTGEVCFNNDVCHTANITTDGNYNILGDVGIVGALSVSGDTALDTLTVDTINGAAADLAENYVSDEHYPAGTVVKIGGEYEITQTDCANCNEVFGIISTQPAYLMNSECHGLPVALEGRVPCRVWGKVQKGDRLVTSGIPGVAMSANGSTINWTQQVGRALESKETDGEGIIEVVVGIK